MAKAAESIPDIYRNSEWHQALETYLRQMAVPGKSDAQVERINARFCDVCNRVMSRPVRTFADLAILAGLACHWNSPLDRGSYPACVIEGADPELSFDDRSLATLVKAVLDMVGLKLDAEGRVRNL